MSQYPSNWLPLKLRNKNEDILIQVFESSFMRDKIQQNKANNVKVEDESSTSGSRVIYKYPGHHKGWVVEEFTMLSAENMYMEDRKMLEAAKKGDMTAVKKLPPRNAKLNAKQFISETIDIQ